jgi:hypothetical protein
MKASKKRTNDDLAKMIEAQARGETVEGVAIENATDTGEPTRGVDRRRSKTEFELS